jgi:hypothetical protein
MSDIWFAFFQACVVANVDDKLKHVGHLGHMVAESLMANNIKPGTVIFTGNHKRLAKFYEAMTGLAVRFTDDNIRNANQMSDMLQEALIK